MKKRTIHSKFLFNKLNLPESVEPPIIIAYALKTPENIGSIIRLADNFGVQRIILVDCNKDIRLTKVKKTAASSYNKVPVEFCSISDLEKMIPEHIYWCALETTSDSKNIYETIIPSNVLFVVGSEINGIHNNLLDKCDQIMHIPLFGQNTSLNVTHALSIALSEWQRQFFR